MKRNVYYLSVLLLAGCMVGGCSDEQGNTANVPAASGEPIRFSVSTDNVKSRTVYDELEEDGWTLDWVTGDEIGIYTTAEDKYVVKYSGGTPVNDGSKYAVYYIDEVNPQGHQHEGTIYWKGDHLVWGESVEEENPWLTFYGAYPAEEVIGVNYPNSGSEGIIQMDYHTNQLAVINKKEGDTYVAPPDMNEAYMIAKRKIQPSGEHILLDFDPIMTTLNLNITAGGYEEKTGIIDPVTITGVSVMMPHGINNGEFKYDTAGMENGTHGELAKDIQSDYKESIYVGIQNGLDNNKRYIDLFEGESVNLFAFLPPVNMENGATIKVHTKGALNFVLNITQEMIKQSRIDIQLPDVSPESENELMVNNWISQLDGNIQLAQMSIPGYDCEDEETPEKIETLLKMGVRVFRIENIINHGGGLMGNSHRNLPDNLVEVFNSFISNNKDEFIILLYEGNNDKYLTDTKLGLSEIDINADNWKTMSISELKGKIVAFERRTVFGSGYVASQIDIILSTEPYTFDQYGIANKEEIEEIGNIYPNPDWNMVYMNWDKNATEGDKIDVTKTIYEKIASENKQDCSDGCTGIILVPNAGITYNQDLEQYTYSDLLIQAIIDCNYKLILDRN